MDRLVFGVSVQSLIVAAAAFSLIAFGIPLLRAFIARRCPVSDPSDSGWRNLVGRLNQRWMRLSTLMLAVVCAIYTLEVDVRVLRVADVVLIATLAVQSIRLVPAALDWIFAYMAGRVQGENTRESTLARLTSLRWFVLFIAYILILLLALQNAGVNVTSLIAGLGIGGIAIALALQNILGDLFASLTISLDRPFVVGDFIIVGNEMGTVEHVGLKTTRVRSLSGEQLVFGNTDLLSSRIRNYKRMSERRVVLAFGLVYETKVERLEMVNTIVRTAIEGQPNVRFDRCHFHQFGESSLNFEAVYYINSPDYNAHMDTQQQVLFAMARSFASQGIQFAFPTRTVVLERAARSQAGASDDGWRERPANPATRTA